MPLDELVSFKAVLQKGNRVQIPRLIRWQFKMESEQVLQVTVAVDVVGENFYARMNKDGRITVPKLALELLEEYEDERSLVGSAFEVTLKPLKLQQKTKPERVHT